MGYDYKTSYPAYKEPGKEKCRAQVLEAIRKLGECNDKQIAEHLNWTINRVTPRRGELVVLGTVIKSGTRKNAEGRAVNFWKVPQKVEQAKLFLDL